MMKRGYGLIAFLLLVLFLSVGTQAEEAKQRQGELRLIGVPSDVNAGRYNSQTGIFFADVSAIPGAYIEITYDDMVITSKIVEWFTKEERLVAQVEVRVVTEDNEITSERLEYWEEEDKAEFRQNVVVIAEDGTFYGDHFVMYNEDERMEFFGPFKAVFNR